MSDWISALWALAGYVVAFLMLVALVAAVMVVLRATIFRRGRIRFAGWAPWWYVGGQPDVPEELTRESTSRRGR